MVNFAAWDEFRRGGFNTRAINVLIQEGCHSPSDVPARLGERELMRLPNCGPKTVRHIKERLSALGFDHRDRVDVGMKIDAQEAVNQARSAAIARASVTPTLSEAEKAAIKLLKIARSSDSAWEVMVLEEAVALLRGQESEIEALLHEQQHGR